MSSVAIQGNASGAGVFTIASPNSASSFTSTLPAITGTLSIAGATTVQVFTSSSGTYTTPANCKSLYIKMCGGGGGGGSNNNSGAGGAGGNTTFGTSLLTANGGAGGGYLVSSGGSFTLNSPAVGKGLTGGGGSGGMYPGTLTNAQYPGGQGGVNPFGGSASANAQSAASGAGVTNTGAGGAGAVTTVTNQYAGAGGGAGGYIEAIINSPSATYSYAVGAAGTAGTGGAYAGGAGGSGLIIVVEYY